MAPGIPPICSNRQCFAAPFQINGGFGQNPLGKTVGDGVSPKYEMVTADIGFGYIPIELDARCPRISAFHRSIEAWDSHRTQRSIAGSRQVPLGKTIKNGS